MEVVLRVEVDGKGAFYEACKLDEKLGEDDIKKWGERFGYVLYIAFCDHLGIEREVDKLVRRHLHKD